MALKRWQQDGRAKRSRCWGIRRQPGKWLKKQTHRWMRRQAKRDPGNAPRKYRFWSWET